MESEDMRLGTEFFFKQVSSQFEGMRSLYYRANTFVVVQTALGVGYYNSAKYLEKISLEGFALGIGLVFWAISFAYLIRFYLSPKYLKPYFFALGGDYKNKIMAIPPYGIGGKRLKAIDHNAKQNSNRDNFLRWAIAFLAASTIFLVLCNAVPYASKVLHALAK